MPTEAPTTSRDLLAMLRRHYVPDDTRPAGIFAEEIQAPAAARRADLVWLGCTAASGKELIGHEIKVTRADLIAELADPTKSDPWQRFCDRWYLVVPDVALVEGLDLPPTWGVLTPPSGRRTRSMTVATKAPSLRPDDQAPAMRTLATWLFWKNHRLDLTHRQLRTDHAKVVRERDELRDASPTRRNPRVEREAEVALRIVRAMGGTTAEGTLGRWPDTVDVDTVVAVLKDVAAGDNLVAFARRDLEAVRGQLRSLGRQIAHTLKETEQAGRPEVPAPRPAS